MHTKNSPKPSKRSDAGDDFKDEDLTEKIGKSLRKMYDDVLHEAVPDNFMDLLTQFDEKKK